MKSNFPANPTAANHGDDHDDRRIAQRLPLVNLFCDRGELLDFSSTGARMETRWPWREGKSRSITISTGSNRITFRARCIWSMREGLFLHTVGVHFEDVTPEQVRMLNELAQMHGARTLGLGYNKAA